MHDVLTQALSLVAIILLGQLLRRAGFFTREDFPKLSRLMLTVTLPCALITYFDSFQIDKKLYYLIFIGIAVNLIQGIAAYLLTRRESAKEQAFAIIHSGSYNIGAFAMPYMQAFMAAESLVYSSLFDIGNALTEAGSNYGLAMAIGKKEKLSAKNLLLQMLHSPVFVTYLFLLILQLSGLRLPSEIIRFTSIVGEANTFLAMFIIGLALDLKIGRGKLKKAFRILLRRYLFALLFSLVTIFLLPLGEQEKTVLCLIYFAPIAAMSAGFTAEIDGDIELAGFISSFSILVSIVVMPLILLILK